MASVLSIPVSTSPEYIPISAEPSPPGVGTNVAAILPNVYANKASANDTSTPIARAHNISAVILREVPMPFQIVLLSMALGRVLYRMRFCLNAAHDFLILLFMPVELITVIIAPMTNKINKTDKLARRFTSWNIFLSEISL